MPNETARAVDLSTRLLDIGFTEFTSDLLSSTFETLTSSTLTQLKAYADLVASVSGTLDSYTRNTLGVDDPTDPSATELRDEWIQENLVAPGLVTPPPDNLASGDYSIDAEDRAELVKLFAGLQSTATPSQTFAEALGDPAPTTMLAAGLVHDFVGQKLKSDVKAERDLLITVLELGMQKLVVTDGKVRTKLTFTTWATESRGSSTTSVSSQASGFSIGGTFARRVFGASASYGRNQITVNVANEHSSGTVGSTTEIIGEVMVCFRTETFDRIERT